MRIERIYVACCKTDLRFTRVCVASVRHWYPDIPISLVKDEYRGSFNTRDIERSWDVSLFPSQQHFGSPLAKLQPMLRSQKETYLLIDADIAFVGPVLDAFKGVSADFVVDPQYRDLDDEFSQLFFDVTKLKRLDPEYQYPGFAFNTGQMVATSGLVTREDFSGLIDWSASRPTVCHPDVFKLSDQGLLNYVLVKKRDRGEMSLATAPKFMMWGGLPEVANIQLPRLDDPEARPLLVHWGGGRVTRSLFRKMYGTKILSFYESLFYSQVPLGTVKRALTYLGIGAAAGRRRANRIVKKFVGTG